MRRTLYIVAAVVVVAAILIPIRTTQERTWVDAVSGSMKRETVSILGRSSGEIVEPSPLHERLTNAEIPWTADWRFLHNTHRSLLGRAVGFECGSAPPIYQIRSVLGDFARVSTDEQLRDFVNVMQSGNEDEQKSTVEAAGKLGLEGRAAGLAGADERRRSGL